MIIVAREPPSAIMLAETLPRTRSCVALSLFLALVVLAVVFVTSTGPVAVNPQNTSYGVIRSSGTSAGGRYMDDSDSLYTTAGQSHLAVMRLDRSRLAPLTTTFQELLYTHQHPSNCAQQDYLVFSGWGAGLGSEVHVGGHHLLCALKLGRVFLWADGAGAAFTEGPMGLKIRVVARRFPLSASRAQEKSGWRASSGRPPTAQQTMQRLALLYPSQT